MFKNVFSKQIPSPPQQGFYRSQISPRLIRLHFNSAATKSDQTIWTNIRCPGRKESGPQLADRSQRDQGEKTYLLIMLVPEHSGPFWGSSGMKFSGVYWRESVMLKKKSSDFIASNRLRQTTSCSRRCDHRAVGNIHVGAPVPFHRLKCCHFNVKCLLSVCLRLSISSSTETRFPSVPTVMGHWAL